MEKEIQEYNELIATRFPPGDSWKLIGEDNIYPSLTDALEAWFTKTGEKVEFRLDPLKGRLYAIRFEEKETNPEPPKRFNLYGDPE